MTKYLILFLLSLNMQALIILPDKNIDSNSWRFIKDQVMGGKSDGFMTFKKFPNKSFDYISAKGNVSTDGGGFLMFRKKITSSELSGFTKVQFKARGNNEKYFLHIKTKGSIFPWVRYLAEFEVSEEWKDYEIKFSEFVKFSNKRQKKNTLNPNKINLFGVEASGRDFEMAIEIASIKFL